MLPLPFFEMSFHNKQNMMGCIMKSNKLPSVHFHLELAILRGALVLLKYTNVRCWHQMLQLNRIICKMGCRKHLRYWSPIMFLHGPASHPPHYREPKNDGSKFPKTANLFQSYRKPIKMNHFNVKQTETDFLFSQ